MNVTCFYDYTCAYSWRAAQWLSDASRGDADVSVAWRTFSIKEANRDSTAPSPFVPAGSGLSVVALALAHAARQCDFGRYHQDVFAAMHVAGDRVEEEQLLAIAADAGVDIDAFNQNRQTWLDAVAAEHREAVERHGVFGTPTLVFDGGTTTFVKLGQVPQPGEAAALWNAMCTLAVCHPELLEIKRPNHP